MSTPPPSYVHPERVERTQPDAASADTAERALAWLSGHAVFQGMTAGAFGGLITGWVAISAALAGAFTYACAMCLLVPILGWFIGFPVLFFTGMMVAMCWLGALAVLLSAWAFVSLFGLLVGLIAQLTASRR